jgi:hypothetical protein
MSPSGHRSPVPAEAISAAGLAFALVRNFVARLFRRTQKGPVSR